VGKAASDTRRSWGLWWVWVIVVLSALMVVGYLVMDAMAGTHGV
jgi:hypothetical protein